MISTKINEQDSISQLMTLKAICSQIYVIRNELGIGYQHLVENELKRIDDLFKPIKEESN